MDDLLKEAIADAKAVRETALENAKIALEEAFTPRLQSMLSKKIQSEIEVDEAEHEDDEEEAPEEAYHEDDEDPTDDDSTEEAMHDDEEEVEEAEHEDEKEVEEEGIIEIDGVKYAPVVSEEEHEEDEMEEEAEDEESDDLDLEAVLRELEEEEDDEEEVKETVKEEEDEEGEEVDEEVDNTTGIGSSDNKTGSADKSSGIGTPGKAKHESVKVTEEEEDDDKEEVEEEIDLEEVIKALSEEEDEEEEVEEVAKLQSDLDEHRNVVKYLRTKLNEVNLLNAKLLFTNKLFRSFGLSNDQKMKVVENFDRAHNLREVKLVYSTLAESFGTKTTKTEIKETKGSASKAVASTKSKKQEVIAEGSELRDRFKKLAGII
jgi:hypothetical protein